MTELQILNGNVIRQVLKMKKSMKYGQKIRAIIISLFLGFSVYPQDTIVPLWPSDAIPSRIESDEEEILEKGAIQKISYVQSPHIEVYLPSEANSTGKAMLIFPGGGYHILAYDWEGSDIAKFLNSKGIAGIVVKYRLPVSKSLVNNRFVPLQDAQRAMRLTRYLSKTWNIDDKKIGIIGFSAGGHLASTLGTHFEDEVYEYLDGADLLSARPDFMALVYPVISFTSSSSVHSGSKKALLGDEPDEESLMYFSNELQVTENTPPTILFHAADDKAVPPENSMLFFNALNQKGVPAELHIYPEGGHGFSLATKNPNLRRWTQHLYEWTLQFE